MKTRGIELLNVNLRWFLLAMVVANIAGQMTAAMMSLYLVDLGASVGDVGLAYTIASLVPIALQIVGGWISDTIGRLRAIAIGSAISVLGYLAFFISPSWEWVMLGLCVEFVSSSFVGPSFSAYIAEQCSEQVRGRVYGLSSGIFMIVSVIGPTLAGSLAYGVSFRFMFIVAFTFYALATLVRAWMAFSERFKPARAAQKPTLSGLGSQLKAMFGLLFAGGILTWIWITDAINDTSYELTGQLFPIYLSNVGHLTVAQIGFLGSAWGVASILGALIGGWLADKTSERAMISSGFALLTGGLVVMILAQSTVGFLASRCIMGFGSGILMPSFESFISKVVPEEKRGLAFGFFGTSLGILSLPMPWIGAHLWETISPQMPFWITAAACAITVPIAWVKFVLPREKMGEPQAEAVEVQGDKQPD